MRTMLALFLALAVPMVAMAESETTVINEQTGGVCIPYGNVLEGDLTLTLDGATFTVTGLLDGIPHTAVINPSQHRPRPPAPLPPPDVVEWWSEVSPEIDRCRDVMIQMRDRRINASTIAAQVVMDVADASTHLEQARALSENEFELVFSGYPTTPDGLFPYKMRFPDREANPVIPEDAARSYFNEFRDILESGGVVIWERPGNTFTCDALGRTEALACVHSVRMDQNHAGCEQVKALKSVLVNPIPLTKENSHEASD